MGGVTAVAGSATRATPAAIGVQSRGDGALGFSALAMEVLVLAAWLRWLGAMNPALAPLGPLSLLAAALAIWPVALRLGRSATGAMGITVLALLATVGSISLLDGLRQGWAGWPLALPWELLTHPLALSGRSLLAATLVWLWWRALIHGQVPLTGVRVRALAARALTAVAILGLVARLTRPVALGAFIYPAAVCALLSLAGAGIRDAQRGPATGQADLGATWLRAAALWSLFLTAIAAWLTSLFWGGLGAEIVAASQGLWDWVADLLVGAAIILGTVGGWLAEAVARLLAPAFQSDVMEALLAFQRRFTRLYGASEDPSVAARGMDWLGWVLRSVLLLGLLTLAVTLLLRALRPARPPVAAGQVRGELEGGLSLQRVGKDVRDLFEQLLTRARSAMGRGGGRREGVPALYARLLALLAGRGHARLPAQTPDEYLPLAVAVLPAAALDIADLTAAYGRVRYGEVEPDGAELDLLRSCWRRIQGVARGPVYH